MEKDAEHQCNSNLHDLLCETVKKDAEFLKKLPADQIFAIRNKMFEKGNKMLDALIDGDEGKEKRSTKRSTEIAQQIVPSVKKKSRVDVSIVKNRTVLETNSSRKSTDSDVTKTADGPDSSSRDDGHTIVTCRICRTDVSYDYIARKDHVRRKHIARTVAKEDLEDLIETNLDIAFPGFQNTDLACQMCVDCKNVNFGIRRKHVEEKHLETVCPLLKEMVCPIDNCGMAYRMQYELNTHLKYKHSISMRKVEDEEWQRNMRRRKCLISEITDKCFPITKVSEPRITKKTNKSVQISQSTVNCSVLNNDVRVRDLNRTRRAQIYNQNDSTSSSSSDDDNELTEISRNRTTSEQLSTTNGENQDAIAVQLAPLIPNEKRVEEVVKEKEEQVTSSAVPVNVVPTPIDGRSSCEISTGASSSRNYPCSTASYYYCGEIFPPNFFFPTPAVQLRGQTPSNQENRFSCNSYVQSEPGKSCDSQQYPKYTRFSD